MPPPPPPHAQSVPSFLSASVLYQPQETAVQPLVGTGDDAGLEPEEGVVEPPTVTLAEQPPTAAHAAMARQASTRLRRHRIGTSQGTTTDADPRYVGKCLRDA
jgi:hypothetical protein